MPFRPLPCLLWPITRRNSPEREPVLVLSQLPLPACVLERSGRGGAKRDMCELPLPAAGGSIFCAEGCRDEVDIRSLSAQAFVCSNAANSVHGEQLGVAIETNDTPQHGERERERDRERERELALSRVLSVLL